MATRDIWRESQQQAAHIYFDASGKPLEVHVVELGIQHTSRETFCDVSEALDRFYSELKSIEDVQTQAHSVRQVLGTCIQRIRRRLEVRSKEISKSLERDALKHKADLILTYLPEVRSVLAAGGRSVELLDPAEGTAIRVELDPRKSASENAQSYYRRYSKERARYEALLPQVQSDQADLAYLEGVLESLEFACSVQHIEDVRSELTQQGFYKPRETRTRSKPSRTGQSTPYFQAIRTSLGDEVLFGTNNKQNDYLTNRVAKPDDLWFHAKDVPGAHVILRNRGDVQQQSIKEAAAIAAAYSKARHSTKVLVDYTHVKHVRKPPGSRPGMVIYDHHRTIAVDPTDARTAKPQ
jgi:predicted ribosome quality control (RQC) complex YloA/Tae2 family protein